MRTFLDAAADLLLGAACPGCATPGWGLCPGCRTQLEGIPETIDRRVPVPLVAACQYRPILEHVIPRYKDDGALHLSGILSDLLVRAVVALEPPRSALLVPVPSRPAAVRQRGFDHAARLAARAAGTAGLGWRPLLSRVHRGLDQQGLDRRQRNANLEGSMRAAATVQPVVVVDDIATSGASVREAVRALRRAGVSVVGAAVIAQAERFPPHSPKPVAPVGWGR